MGLFDFVDDAVDDVGDFISDTAEKVEKAAEWASDIAKDLGLDKIASVAKSVGKFAGKNRSKTRGRGARDYTSFAASALDQQRLQQLKRQFGWRWPSPSSPNLVALHVVGDAVDDYLRYLKRFEVTHVVSAVPTPVLIWVVARHHLHSGGGKCRNRGGKTYSYRRNYSGGIYLDGG